MCFYGCCLYYSYGTANPHATKLGMVVRNHGETGIGYSEIFLIYSKWRKRPTPVFAGTAAAAENRSRWNLKILVLPHDDDNDKGENFPQIKSMTAATEIF